MIRLSKQADYAILLMSLVARRGNGVTSSSSELAKDSRLAEPMTRKVLKMLTRADLLTSLRGVAGGYQLARSPEMITVTDIIAAVDGPIAITECAEDAASSCSCQQESVCVTRPHWLRINEAIRGALRGISLASMASSVTFGVMAPVTEPGALPPGGMLLTEEDDLVLEVSHVSADAALLEDSLQPVRPSAPIHPNESDPS